MPLLNFNEIPQANNANGEQDTFELFARDFCEMLGFKIESGPDRGQDGGRDIIIIREGILNTSEIRWLVSCKHKSHSGKAVLDSEEQDISDRLKAHNCKGFMGFYSTIVSAPLNKKLENLKKEFEVSIFDKEKIEKILLSSSDGIKIIQRYFPKSFEIVNDKKPSNLLSEYKPLNCVYCGKDLLSSENLSSYNGIIVFVEDIAFWEKNNGQKTKFLDVYWSCKGKCDEIMEDRYYKKGGSTSWQDISDIIIPFKYVQFNLAIL